MNRLAIVAFAAISVALVAGCKKEVEKKVEVFKQDALIACEANRRQISAAAEQYYMTNGEYPKSLAAICGPSNYIKTEPRCPGGGTYSVEVGSSGSFSVRCSTPGHTRGSSAAGGAVQPSLGR